MDLGAALQADMKANTVKSEKPLRKSVMARPRHTDHSQCYLERTQPQQVHSPSP